jgi:hypothetical protein
MEITYFQFIFRLQGYIFLFKGKYICKATAWCKWPEFRLIFSTFTIPSELLKELYLCQKPSDWDTSSEEPKAFFKEVQQVLFRYNGKEFSKGALWLRWPEFRLIFSEHKIPESLMEEMKIIPIGSEPEKIEPDEFQFIIGDSNEWA